MSAILRSAAARGGWNPEPVVDIIVSVSFLILGIWYAAIAGKGIAAYRLYNQGLVARFPTVWAFLTVDACRSLLLTLLSNRVYRAVYSATGPLMMLLEAFAVVGVFWAIAEQYPRFQKPGAVILTCLAAIGACVAWLTQVVAVPADWSAPWQALQLFERHCVLGMTVVLAGSRFLLPRIPGLPIRRSALRMADILTLRGGIDLLAYTIFIAMGARFVAAAQILNIGGTLLCTLAIATLVNRASDECSDLRPVTAEDDADMARAERFFDQLVHTSNQTR